MKLFVDTWRWEGVPFYVRAGKKLSRRLTEVAVSYLSLITEGGTFDLMAGITGPSTYSLPNILGNIANKYLRAGFLGVDSAWNQIASKRSNSDLPVSAAVSLVGREMSDPIGTEFGMAADEIAGKAITSTIMVVETAIARTRIMNRRRSGAGRAAIHG